MADQNLENLEMLVTVSRLLSSRLELSDLLTYIMQLASRVVLSERTSLFLLDEKTNELYFDVALGLSPELQQIRLKLGEGIAGTCAKEGRSIIVNDTVADSRHAKKLDKKSGFTTRSVLSCPLIIKGRVIGVVQALNKTDGDFTQRDLRNFEAFASQAAIAIENARLFSSLREEKRKLQLAFSQTKEGNIMLGRDGVILLANDAARGFLGADAASGVTFAQALDGMTISPAIDTLLSSEAEILPFLLERSAPKKLCLEGCCIRIKDGANVSASSKLLIFRDVTAQKTEETLARNFLSLISHKLRTPLTVITGYADILKDDAALADFSKKAADTISRQSRKLSVLVEVLLNYVAIDELTAEAVEKKPELLCACIQDACAAIAAHTDGLSVTYGAPLPQNAKTAVTVSCPEDIKLNCDRRLIKSAIEYLIDNGFKFNCRPVRLVNVAASAKDGEVTLTVKDNGAGIPPEEFGRIFDKFYQIESSFTGQVEGWGIGLAFVKKAVSVHGGKITISSKPGEGSEFRLVLPAGL